MKKILVLCTGNSCRSQMAEAFLKSFDPNIEVFSAGTNPSEAVHKKAIQVMQEIGIDISKNKPKHVTQFLNTSFDYVITVCSDAKSNCPIFMGKVKKNLHIGFYDPADAMGSDKEVLKVFREIRDDIRSAFLKFYTKEIRL